MTESTAEKHSNEGAFVGERANEPLTESDEPTEGEPTDHSQSAGDADETFNWVDAADVKEPAEGGVESAAADEPAPADADEPETDAPSTSTSTDRSPVDETDPAQTAESTRTPVEGTTPDRSQSTTTAGSTEESSGVFGRLRSRVGGLF